MTTGPITATGSAHGPKRAAGRPSGARQTDGSSGRITFQKLDCRTGGEVAFMIAAVVGSEFGNGPPVRVTGSFRGPVGTPPF